MPHGVRIDMLEGGVCAVTLDGGDSPFVFDEPRIVEFANVIAQIRAKAGVNGLVVRSTRKDTFCAGADVDSIASVKSPHEIERLVMIGQNAFEELARLPFPTVALIGGAAMGGGCELALSCSARVATDQAKIGLPETKLGILPAWGGSTRLPRLIGLLPAIELITAGKVVNASRAKRLGLVDSIVAYELMEREARRLIDLIRGGSLPPRPRPPLSARILAATPPGRSVIRNKATAAILHETRGHYPAPLAALDVLMRQHGRARAEGFDLERTRVAELLQTQVARELIRLFQITRDGARPPIYAASATAPAVAEAAVIGAGVMGAGIAQVLVARGFPTRIIDAQPASLSRAKKAIDDELRRLVQRKDLAESDRQNRLAKLSFSTEINGLAGVDLVIEAVPERRDIKDAVLKKVAAQVRDTALIATNTSSFALGELMTSVTHPERFLGVHFFNPAPKMPLVEVVRGPSTSEATLLRGLRFVRDIGKTALVVNDGPGFLVNRLLAPYLFEAAKLAEEGVPITAIDRALEDFGMPMGPFVLMDTIGLDVLKDVSEHLAGRTGQPMHPLILRLAERKDFGKKTGRGFYIHGKERLPNPDAVTGVKPREGWLPYPREMSDRLVDKMIAEATSALGEGLVAGPDEVDIGTIFGIGFPPFRGGLMRYAESVKKSATPVALSEVHA